MKRGFSLVELLIVLAVIAAIIAVFVPVASNALKKASSVAMATDIRTLSNGLFNRVNIDHDIPDSLSELGRNIDRSSYGLAWRKLAEYYEFVIFSASSVDVAKVSAILPNVRSESPEGDFTFLADGRNSFSSAKVFYHLYMDPLGVSTQIASIYDYEFGSGKTGVDVFESTHGTWNVTDEDIVPTTPLNQNNGESRVLLPGDDTAADYTVEVRVLYEPVEPPNGYAIYVRATGSADSVTGYAFQVDPGYNRDGFNGGFIVRRVDNGSEEWTPIIRAAFSNFGISRDSLPSVQNITITAEGNHFTMTFNGVKVLDFTDNRYSTGRVGLRRWGNDRVVFQNLRVR